MRRTALLSVICTCLGFTFASGTDKYSVRDVGFADIETRPYRILMVAKDPSATAVKDEQTLRRKEIEHANVTLEVFAADSKQFALEFPAIKLPDNLARPLYWIVAPEKEAPISALDPGRSLPELLRSKLRDNLFEKVTHALCVVVLLESKDKDANAVAKEKAEMVINQINEVRRKFFKAPDENIELVRLLDAERKQERWTLWALGEKEESTEMPKIAVVYGKLRRAGPLFVGTDWDDAGLFARIAWLAQEWDGDARKPIAGPALPYVWSDWPGNHKLALDFDPVAETPKIKKLLDRPPVKAPKERKLKYEDWSDPPFHPPVDPNAGRPDPPIVQPETPPFTPPYVSSTDVGVVLLIIGLIGWIALGGCVWFLEQNRPASR